MTQETSKPYGYFGSAEEVCAEIKRRFGSNKPILGSGIIYPGAVIIKGMDGSISMVYGDKAPPMIEFNVSPRGEIILSADKPIPGFGPWRILD